MGSAHIRIATLENAPQRAQLAHRSHELCAGLYQTQAKGNYSTCYEPSLEFGEDLDRSAGDHLVLCSTRGEKIVALKWRFAPIAMSIEFVQRLPHADIAAMRTTLGAHPSEVLVSDFILRLRPLLVEFPYMPVTLEGRSHPHNVGALRDRFLEPHTWRLNPNRERVAKILGAEVVQAMKLYSYERVG